MEKNIQKLLKKLQAGQCSKEELNYLQAYFNSSEIKELEEAMKKDWEFLPAKSFSKEKKDRIRKNILSEIRQKPQKKTRKLFPVLKYAAVFIGLGFLAYLFFQDNLQEEPQISEITIELNDGSIRSLDQDNGEGEESLFSLKNGKLIYTGEQEEKEPGKIEYNTVRVPYGKTLRIVLSDRSEVHLNAGSSLKYPVHFLPDTNREVFLKGEAYFEAAHDLEEKFVVHSNHLKTEVLGTRFLVNSYEEDEAEKVVLAEGSVAVTSEHQEGRQILEPDEMTVLNKKNHTLNTQKVDAADFLAWTNGVLLFRNEKFEEIVPKLERHYNIEITTRDSGIKQERFTGRFSTENIEEVLEVFQKASGFEFKKNENKIIINRKN